MSDVTATETTEHAAVVRRVGSLMALAIGGITAVIVLASWSAGQTRMDARAFAEQDVPALRAALGTETGLLEARSSLNDATRVVDAAQAEALAQYEAAVSDVRVALASYRELTDGDEQSAVLADEFESAFEEWQLRIADVVANPHNRADVVRFANDAFGDARTASDAMAADVSARRVDAFNLGLDEDEERGGTLRIVSLVLVPLAGIWSWRTVARIRELLAEGRRATRRSTQRILAASEETNGLSGGVSSTAYTLEQLSDDLLNNATEVSEHARETSGTAREVDEHVASVAAAMEEMSAAIREIANHVSSATNVTTAAVDAAHSTTATVSSLGSSSREIGEVVAVIAKIAEQTNMLALNATIEAARAGEHGQGFAVVANEVKDLARSTAEATSDIERRITAIQQDAEESVQHIEEIGTVIDQIAELQGHIAAAVEEQTAATAEVTTRLHDAATGTASIEHSADVLLGSATNNQERATRVRETAAELTTLAENLRLVAEAAAEGQQVHVGRDGDDRDDDGPTTRVPNDVSSLGADAEAAGIDWSAVLTVVRDRAAVAGGAVARAATTARDRATTWVNERVGGGAAEEQGDDLLADAPVRAATIGADEPVADAATPVDDHVHAATDETDATDEAAAVPTDADAPTPEPVLATAAAEAALEPEPTADVPMTQVTGVATNGAGPRRVVRVVRARPRTP